MGETFEQKVTRIAHEHNITRDKAELIARDGRTAEEQRQYEYTPEFLEEYYRNRAIARQEKDG